MRRSFHERRWLPLARRHAPPYDGRRRFHSQRWYPPSPDAHSLPTGSMIGEGALVRAVDVQLDKAVRSITQHKCSPAL